MKRIACLSIAGFDPSGGAGLLSDIKTFEQNRVLGLGVQTANTFQNDAHFEKLNWVDVQEVIYQIELLKKFDIRFVKIGLVQSFEVLRAVLNYLKANFNNPKIIWDPILKTSSGYDFEHKMNELNSVLDNIFMITPNWEEIQLLGSGCATEVAKKMASHTSVYLKGGHNPNELGKDYLFSKGKQYSLNPKLKNISEKHGSGCVLSSAITSFLANGYPLLKACLKGKQYTERVLSSNKSLLGYHNL